jgi:HEAT repeat protein
MSKDSPQFHSLLTTLSSADLATAALPLASEAFWSYVIERGAGAERGVTPDARPVAEDLLARRLDDEGATARRSAAIALLGGADRETRRRAMRLLAETDGSPAALEAAVRAARDQDEELGVEALRLLINHPSPATLPALLEALESRFDARETVAAEGLVDAGAAGVPGLTSLLEHEDQRIRWRAARCLTRIARNGHPETLPALLRAFHDDSPDVDWVAADGLLALGPTASVPMLRSVLAEPLTGGTIKALRLYAQKASPAQVFRPVADATRRSGDGTATLVAVDKALRTLEAGQAR